MTEIKSAVPELIALAEAMREDWDAAELRGALVGAKERGWSWPRTLTATVTLMVNPDRSPRDLRAESASPLHPEQRESSPDVRAAAVAEAMRAASEAQAARAAALAAGETP